ncbi:SDR family oxidoreductase [Streptomyces hoynatensis]|uniref:SDR family oxidoreductase n=1 Tax=Streptomyces hoynatensis TaxID=1141874 RepID=UPI0030C8CD7A
MFPPPVLRGLPVPPAPRARGVVPHWERAIESHAACSPRTRGCSLLGHVLGIGDQLLPTHAGLFPCKSRRPVPLQSPQHKPPTRHFPNPGARRPTTAPQAKRHGPTDPGTPTSPGQPISARRLVTPQEVAKVIAFLLSPTSSGITDVNIPVDNGQNTPTPDGS